MKRIISFAAALSMIFGAASCQKDLENKEGDSQVSFSFELPQETVTKGTFPYLSEGRHVNELIYEVYVGNDRMYNGAIARNEDGKFSLELNLVTGQTYDLLFWAQHKAEQGETSFYSTSSLKRVRVNYNGQISNNDERDAFYGSRKGFTPTGIATQETVYLYRPFAQVNFATSQADYTSAASFTDQYLKSSVFFDRLPNVFNVYEGDIVEGEYVKNVTFDYSMAPIKDQSHVSNYISYNATQYPWVAMNYVLASKEEMTVTAEARFVHEKNNPENALKKNVPNVPIKQNYRTNILGEYFTGGNKFEIIIRPGFVNSENNIQNPEYVVTIPIRKTFEIGGEISLDQDLKISTPFELKNGVEVKVNLNGYDITCDNGSDAFVVTNGTLTIEGTGTVKTQDMTAGYGIIADGPEAVVYVKGGNYIVGVDNVAQYGDVAANSAVYAKNGGKAYVSGGSFKVETTQPIEKQYKTRFLLNLKDKTADGSQDDNLIVVTGGKFYDFNPANNIAEGANTDFVADGYKSEETSTGVWTVSAE